MKKANEDSLGKGQEDMDDGECDFSHKRNFELLNKRLRRRMRKNVISHAKSNENSLTKG